ncbi:unnamed protein product [Prunus armeniaca]
MATADEPPSAPIVPPTAKVASAKPPRAWRPRQDDDIRGMTAVSVELKAVALEGADEGIIDVYHRKDPPFSANGLSFLMEFHKDHSTINLYGMTPENREIVELALRNGKAERLYTSRTERPEQEGCQVTDPSRENWRPSTPSAEAIWNTSADILL